MVASANIAAIQPLEVPEGISFSFQIVLPTAPSGSFRFVVKDKNTEAIALQLTSPSEGISISGTTVTLTCTNAANKLRSGGSYFYLLDELLPGDITLPWLQGELLVTNR